MKSRIGLKALAKRRNIDKLMTAFAIVEPLSTLPQIFAIYKNQKAEDLSMASWLLYLLCAIVWLVYGLRIKNLPLIVSSIFWIITELLVVVGIIIY